MEEEYLNGKKKVDEKKLMIREAGFVALVIILFLQYFKLAAYLENEFFFNSYFMSYIVLFLGIPLCYFAAKYLVKVIKKVI
ncbi:hypothetical protein [Sporosarcina highlanderae]|uniref:DUF3955 domain-containing protein n=1 Tax=Sporosarcina highlanderae TaxID=3035916 RepID=A0ABT8JTW1_9BACL|nr:hypothetical protein [Sporosarcina highlanderae]MDN4608550.1 hypothetical protein [Sporosarcina highlanderae]